MSSCRLQVCNNTLVFNIYYLLPSMFLFFLLFGSFKPTSKYAGRNSFIFIFSTLIPLNILLEAQIWRKSAFSTFRI